VTGINIGPGADCASGGVMYTSADGNHLVCNGEQGAKGDTGAQGPPGDSTGGGASPLFGDGSDGDVTITAGTTLTRDMYYHNLTINAGQTLNPGGFRIFVSGTLTFDAGGGASISRDGLGGCSGTGCGSNGLVAGTLGGSSGAIALKNSLGGSGGFGGAPGDIELPPSPAAGGRDVFRSATQAISGRSLDGFVVNGGGGGGPAVVNGVFAGGGGGGGGVVVVAVRTIVFNGSEALISAAGGTGSSVGGGGGGGGVVVVITTSPQPAGLKLSATGGGGSGGGVNGVGGFTAWLN